MTSAVGGGGGSQKNRQKEQNQLFCDSDRRGKKIRKFCGHHILKPPNCGGIIQSVQHILPSSILIRLEAVKSEFEVNALSLQTYR